MDDQTIIGLFLERNQQAIAETQAKYARYIRSIAKNVIKNPEDAEECENDVYLAAWNNIPPTVPTDFRSYLGKTARNAAISLYRKLTAGKRGGTERDLSIEELAETLGDEVCPGDTKAGESSSVEDALAAKELSRELDAFLRTLKNDERRLFLRRYWYYESIEEIAERYSYTKSRVKTSLFRTREKLKKYLEKEGITV